MSKVTVLQDGYVYTDENGCYRASATASLIQNGCHNILVDGGGAWEKEQILKRLKDHNVEISDVDIVVGTHGHSDHVGNLNLFPHAKQIVGFDINVKDVFLEHDLRNGKPYSLVDNEIVVIATPGHTHSDISVVVYNEVTLGVVGICGDLFECETDSMTNSWKTISENVDMQEANRQKMISVCEYIVPGHGAMFKNAKK